MLTYKGYTGHVERDEAAGRVWGRVVDGRAVIRFEGQTMAEARQAFKRSVDEYLALGRVSRGWFAWW